MSNTRKDRDDRIRGPRQTYSVSDRYAAKDEIEEGLNEWVTLGVEGTQSMGMLDVPPHQTWDELFSHQVGSETSPDSSTYS